MLNDIFNLKREFVHMTVYMHGITLRITTAWSSITLIKTKTGNRFLEQQDDSTVKRLISMWYLSNRTWKYGARIKNKKLKQTKTEKISLHVTL